MMVAEGGHTCARGRCFKDGLGGCKTSIKRKWARSERAAPAAKSSGKGRDGRGGKLIFKRVFSVRDTGCFNSAQEDIDLGIFLAKKYSNPLLSVGWVAFSHLVVQ